MKGWTTATLGDLCQIELGATPPRGSPRYWDTARKTHNVWLSIADLPLGVNAVVGDSKEYLSDEGAARGKIVKNGTLLVSFKLTLGRLAFAGCDLRTNEAIAALTIRNECAVQKEFLYWYLTYFDWQKAAEGDEKVKGKTLNKAKLKELPIILPPIEEQRRTVAVLDEAFAAIATATANAEHSLALARRLIPAAIDQGLGEFVTGKYVRTLNDACDLIVDCEHKTAPLSSSDIVSIRTPNIGFGELLLDGANTVSEKTFSEWTRRAVPQAGDLIFAREAPAGNVAVVPNGLRCVLGQRTVLLRPKLNEVDPQFLAMYLLHSKTQKRLISHSTGATVQHINMRDIRGLLVEVLPSLAVQKALVSNFTMLREEAKQAIALRKAKLSQFADLKQSLLQRAFTGELTATAPDLIPA